MKNHQHKKQVSPSKKNWFLKLFNAELIYHLGLLLLLWRYAFGHKSIGAVVLIGVFSLVYVAKDLATIFEWGLFVEKSDPNFNRRYIRLFMLFVAFELEVTITIGILAKIWNSTFLPVVFLISAILSIPLALKTLSTTSYLVKNWSRSVVRNIT
jgi:hypothetical protein